MDIRLHTCPKCGKTWYEDCNSDNYPNYCPGCGAELPVGHTGTLQAKASIPIKPASYPQKLWMRAGVSMTLTAEEVDAILSTEEIDAGTQAVVETALREGRFMFDGNSYIPMETIEDYNDDNGTNFALGEPEFDLFQKAIKAVPRSVSD